MYLAALKAVHTAENLHFTGILLTGRLYISIMFVSYLALIDTGNGKNASTWFDSD